MTNVNAISNVTELVMTSREIAELTGKQHKNVLRDIRSMLSDLEIDGLRFERIYLDAKGEQRKEYRLPKNLTMTLVTGYRADLRFRVVNRLIELEETAVNVRFDPNSLTRMDMLRLALEAEEQLQQKSAEIIQLRPYADGYKRIAVADGSLCITDAAKALGIDRPKDLFRWMNANDWIYRRSGNAAWLAYQDKIKKGLLEHKVTEVTRSDGTEKITEQCRVTPKGLARLAALFAVDHGVSQ